MDDGWMVYIMFLIYFDFFIFIDLCCKSVKKKYCGKKKIILDMVLKYEKDVFVI